MARLFDVGALPQIGLPEVLDTQPLVPFDLGNMAKATSDKMQIDLRAKSEERQQRMLEANMLKMMSDDVLQVLKSGDGSNLSGISPFQKRILGEATAKTTSAINDVYNHISAGNYAEGYKTLFDAKNSIFQDPNYRTAVDQIENMKGLLTESWKNPGKYDEEAIKSVINDISMDEDGSFDLARFRDPNLAKFDADAVNKSLVEGFKPKEFTNYTVFSPDMPEGLRDQIGSLVREGEQTIEFQQSPDDIRKSLSNYIQNNERYKAYLDVRKKGTPGTPEYDAYLNTLLSGDALLSGPGVSQMIQEDPKTGTKTILGVYRVKGYEGVKELPEMKDAREAAAKAAKAKAEGGDPWDLGALHPNETQKTILANPWDKDLKSYQDYFVNTEREYLGVRQAFEGITKGVEVVGMVGTSQDPLQNLVTMANNMDMNQLKASIVVKNPDGTVNEDVEKRLLEVTLPAAVGVEVKMDILNRGKEHALTNTYPQFVEEYKKQGGKEADLAKIGVQVGPNGEPILPDYGKLSMGEGTSDPTYFSKTKAKIAYDAVINKNLPERYNDYIAPQGRSFKYFTTQEDESSLGFVAHRTLERNVVDDFAAGNLSLYSANEEYAKGQAMSASEFQEKSKTPDLGPWSDLEMEGIYVNPKQSSFGIVAYPRVPIGEARAATLQNSGNTTGKVVRDEKGMYWQSNEQVVIPWNKFPPEFYDSYYQKYGNYKNLYDGVIEALGEDVKPGQPVRIDYGGHDVFITPKGPVGSNRQFEMVVPAPLVGQVEAQELPAGTTSNVYEPKKYEIKSIKKIDPKDYNFDKETQATESMSDLVESKPYLSNTVPTKPAAATAVKPVSPSTTSSTNPFDINDRIYHTNQDGVKEILERSANNWTVISAERKQELFSPDKLQHVKLEKSTDPDSNIISNIGKEAALALSHMETKGYNGFSDQFIVTSTHRSDKHPEEKDKATGGGKHTSGQAIDISSTRGAGVALAARIAGASRIGPEALDKLYLEVFGTKDIKVLYPGNDKDHQDHIHIQFI